MTDESVVGVGIILTPIGMLAPAAHSTVVGAPGPGWTWLLAFTGPMVMVLGAVLGD